MRLNYSNRMCVAAPLQEDMVDTHNSEGRGKKEKKKMEDHEKIARELWHFTVMS
jgi:hypothetical protein